MSNFKQSLSPIIWTHCLTGMSIFELPDNVFWPKLTIFYAIALASSYSYVFWSKFNMSMEEIQVSSLIILIFQFVLICNVIAAALSSILFLFNWKVNLKFIRQITWIDETLQSFGVSPMYAQEKDENLRILVFWLLAMIILLISGIVTNIYIYDTIEEVIIQTLSFFWPQILNTLIEITFWILLKILQKRFERLNALIYNAVKNSSKESSYQNIDKYEKILMDNQYYEETISSYYEKNRNDLEYLLPCTRQLHLDLCSVSRSMNRMLGVQITMQISIKFALLVGYSYCFYLLVLEFNTQPTIKLCFCIFVAIRIVYGAVRFLLMIKASENITAEAQKTSQLVQEIDDTRMIIINEIHQYTLQILQHPLYFTACGLYVLDYNFVQSFAGSVAFYLIILIQNHSAIEKKTEDIIDEVVDSNSSTTVSTNSFT